MTRLLYLPRFSPTTTTSTSTKIKTTMRFSVVALAALAVVGLAQSAAIPAKAAEAAVPAEASTPDADAKSCP
ncbi:hypothetical protein BGZ94_004300 [Podila epigama]|nr:hypothetical protein BGZ94_004300 [Podila epigama]